MPLFHARLIAHRENFVPTMTPDEQAVMGAHGAFLQEQLAAGTLVVAGPVFAQAGPYGMGVFEIASAEALTELLARDPARTLARYEISPMGPSMFRPKAG
jgi:uncharacterized protein YciI